MRQPRPPLKIEQIPGNDPDPGSRRPGTPCFAVRRALRYAAPHPLSSDDFFYRSQVTEPLHAFLCPSTHLQRFCSDRVSVLIYVHEHIYISIHMKAQKSRKFCGNFGAYLLLISSTASPAQRIKKKEVTCTE